MQTTIEFTRINNDTNGNPRYVCHFLDMLNETELAKDYSNSSDIFGITSKYNYALSKAKKIGGRKFHNKQYGGGIVFQSYNIQQLENQINQLKSL